MIDTVDILKCGKFHQNIWISGLDMSIFQEEKIRESYDKGETKSFDMTVSDEQKRKFVEECIKEYKNIIGDRLVCWKGFQEYLKSRLNIPKHKYRSLPWKEHFNEVHI